MVYGVFGVFFLDKKIIPRIYTKTIILGVFGYFDFQNTPKNTPTPRTC